MKLPAGERLGKGADTRRSVVHQGLRSGGRHVTQEEKEEEKHNERNRRSEGGDFTRDGRVFSYGTNLERQRKIHDPARGNREKLPSPLWEVTFFKKPKQVQENRTLFSKGGQKQS